MSTQIMAIISSMVFPRLWRVIFVLSFQSVASAQISSGEFLKPSVDYQRAEGTSGKLHISARNVPLKWVFDQIAKQEGLLIHPLMLPNEPINISCTEPNLKRMLECLVNRKADLIVRYQDDPIKSMEDKKLAEIWVLGNQVDSEAFQQKSDALTGLMSSANLSEQPNSGDRIAELLRQVQSENPEIRALAAGAFLAEGLDGNPDIKLALEKALGDEDANVRSQALASYAHREDSAAVTEALQTALNDDSPAVRLMAVDNIANDVALLQEAINDSDESVRNLAVMKLEQLTQ